MIKLLLILILVVVAAHVVTSLFRRRGQPKTSGDSRVDRDNSNRDKAIDVEFTEISEEKGAGSNLHGHSDPGEKKPA